MTEKQKSLFMENKFIIISVALLVAVTVFFFGPLEIFLAAPTEFWFSVGDVLPLIAISTLGCFLLLFLILFLLSKLGRLSFRLGVAAVAGVGLALYIQGNWTFVDYGTMDGSPLDWSQYAGWAVVNSVIWLVILASVVLGILLKPQVMKGLAYVAMGIVGVEILTLGTLCISTVGKSEDAVYSFSTLGQLELSTNKDNVIVVLADGFDGKDFLPALAAEAQFEECFDGFTFYEDTIGTSLFSQESGITLLTGNQFEVGPSFSDNVKKAYENTALYNELAENNYKTYLYISNEAMVPQELCGQVENYKEGAEIRSMSAAFEKIYTMVAFRYVPHVMKTAFWYASTDFADLKDASTYTWSNFDFYDVIKEKGVVAKETDSNIYQFYWIQGPHAPIVMDRYCNPLEEDVELEDEGYSDSQFEQTVGVIRMFTELIAALKEAGTYDNTTIIFTADHGWDMRQNPLLLVKPAGATGDMEISEAPVSMVEDYMPTMLRFITGDTRYGNTIFDLEGVRERSRVFYVYDIDSSDRTYKKCEPYYYEAGVFSSKYTLGETINPDALVNYAMEGFSNSETSLVWTDGYKAEMRIRFTEEHDNLLLEMSHVAYGEDQRVRLYANDCLVEEYTTVGGEEKQIVIPGEYIKNGQLSLCFELPDAVSPKEAGNGSDGRKLALAFKSMRLSSIDK